MNIWACSGKRAPEEKVKIVSKVSKVCKRFRTESTQNEVVLVHHTARKQQPAKRMTIARYGEEYGAFFNLDK